MGALKYFSALKASLFSPEFERQKLGADNLNQESYPENTNKKINLAETSAAVAEDGQHSSSAQSSCLWFAWHKN